MMDELILSGYCRCADGSRMVTAEKDGNTWYVDCNYGNCPYEGSCDIAKRLKEQNI